MVVIHRTFILTLLGACAMLTANVSCSDAGTDPPPSGSGSSTVSFANQIQPIFNNNGCTGCHGASGGLSLTTGQSYTNLVNAQSQAACTDKKRVKPENAAQSVLYIRVSANTADTECGTNSRMPKGSSRLSQAQIDLIRDWINQGAANN